jgi:hypothetical protein
MDMHTRINNLGATLFVTVALIAATVPIIALAQSPPQDTAPEATKKPGIRQNIGDAAEAIGKYTAAQREEAVRTTKAALDDIDSRLDTIEADISRHWSSMSQAARDEAQKTLVTLRRQRNNLAEWYGGVKHSSAEAWEEVKRGFASSYQALAESLSQAKKKF